MEKLKINKNKVLKLTNVLVKILSKDELKLYHLEVQKLKNYLKIKGTQSIGPIIQYTNVFVDTNGKLDMEIRLLLQSKDFIHNVEAPFHMESSIRVKNCMYIRYQGEESRLKFAYDKINLTAFEEDISLKGDSYTIFVDQQDDYLIADVFMERADND